MTITTVVVTINAHHSSCCHHHYSYYHYRCYHHYSLTPIATGIESIGIKCHCHYQKEKQINLRVSLVFVLLYGCCLRYIVLVCVCLPDACVWCGNFNIISNVVECVENQEYEIEVPEVESTKAIPLRSMCGWIWNIVTFPLRLIFQSLLSPPTTYFNSSHHTYLSCALFCTPYKVL